jgi:alpha-amylase
METAYVDLASSVYEGEQKALLTAVTASAGAQLVYTTNGSDPTASSTKVASGTTITIPIGTTTLKVGLLINNQVSGIITRNYTVKEKKSTEVVIPDFCHYAEGDVCAFFEAPVTWTQTIKCWAWNNSPAENFTSATGTWPGADCTYLGEALNGNKVWKWKWDGTREKNTTVAQPGMIIFSNGSNGSPKTADLQFKNGGYYTKEGFFGLVTAGVNDVTLDKNANDIIYDLQGRKVVNGQLPRGIYIKNGKKFIVR